MSPNFEQYPGGPSDNPSRPSFFIGRGAWPKCETALAGLALISVATPALAQDIGEPTASPDGGSGSSQAGTPQVASDNQQQADIVVTGTLIRGIAPVGTNVVDLNRDAILATGANSSMQVLSQIAQVGNTFNQVPTVPNGGVATTIIRPNLRNLPSGGGGSTTLVLVDGHRAVPAGTLQTTPDPEVIPPSVLERVDIVPDGGSAIYGSDAIGGVINFITRRRFDGVEFAGHYGFADDYRTLDFNLTVGSDWGSGSAYLSYAFADHDGIFGRDRDYVRQFAPSTGACSPGMVRVTRAGVTTTYALPDRVPGTVAACDVTDNATVFPSQQRHSLFGGLTQEITHGVDLDIRAFYARRRTLATYDLNAVGSITNYGQTATITSANPFYVPIAPDPGSQSVSFSYVGLFDDQGRNTLQEYGGAATVTADLGSDWQLRVLGNWGRSEIDASYPWIDSASQAAALAGTTTATALNPYDPAATNPTVLAGIYRRVVSPARQELLNGRAILEGRLATLPGGDVRLAVGSEVIHESYSNSQDFYAPGVAIPTQSTGTSTARTVRAAFGELVVPLVGAGNAMPGVRSLVFSASGRYDDYSDVGGTFNPKLGLTYRPVQWITVRGNWGKSFNAPSQTDTRGIAAAQLFNFSPVFDPADGVASLLRPEIVLAGSNPSLQPQTADTWSLGLDLRPPAIDGLQISGTYYNIHLSNLFGIIPYTSPIIFGPDFAAYVIKNPTLAQARDIVDAAIAAGASVTGNFTSVDALFAAGTPYAILDLRQQNLGRLRQDGIDFSISYDRRTAFGAVFGNVGGTYALHRRIAPQPGDPFVNALDMPGASRFSLLARIGARLDRLTGIATFRHTAGYDLNPAVNGQLNVGSFNTVDLSFAYDLPDHGILRNLSLTLNVDNVFDQDPPLYRQDPGYTNGSTLGRLIQFGIRKRF